MTTTQAPPLTVPEVAQQLRVSRGHVYNLVKRGELPAFHVGAAIRVDPDRLAEWLAREEH